jgi:ankyrin repeat protein
LTLADAVVVTAGGDELLALHAAAAGGNVGALRVLLAASELGYDVNSRTRVLRRTPLMVLLQAAASAQTPQLAALLALRPDVNAAAADGDTALAAAARVDTTPDGALVRALLQAGADPNVADAVGATPLHAAAAGGGLAALDALILGGARFTAPPSVTTSPGAPQATTLLADTPRHASADGGGMAGDIARAEAEEELARRRQWRHPIHVAIAAGHAAVVGRLLRAHRVPLDTALPHTGDTLLHAAVARGGPPESLLPVLHELLAARADAMAAGGAAGTAAAALLEVENDEGATPLAAAVAASQPAAALVLLEAGASAAARAPLRLRDDLPDALAMAATTGQVGLVQALLARGADANAANDFGETTFMTACVTGRLPVVRALLAHGAEPAASVRGTGETALHLLAGRTEDGASQDAAAGGAAHDAPARAEVARLLLAQPGVDVNARTTLGGHTPVWLAAFHGSPRLAAALARHGGDPSVQDDGKNPSLARADALAAPALNEARRAYAASPAAFLAECAATASAVRAAWREHLAGVGAS